MAGKFELFQGKGDYRFRLKAGNGEPILASEGYTNKSGAESGIASVKANAPIDARYDRLVARNGQYYFNLKASNGQIIGTSEMYASTSGRDNGIDSVKRNAPTALVVDLT